MVPTALYALSFAALAAAQSSSTTVSLFFPNADSQNSLVGSVLGSDATATTYVVGCAGAASTVAATTSMAQNSSNIGEDVGCGLPGSQTVTQGPSTYHWVVSEKQIGAALTVDCALSGTTQAVCSETASGSALTAAAAAASSGTAGNFGAIPPLTTATLTGSGLPPFQQVVITAGLSNLKGAGTSSTGSAAAGQSTGSGSAASSGSTTKPSSGAMVMEPAMAIGVAGMLAVGMAAFAL